MTTPPDSTEGKDNQKLCERNGCPVGCVSNHALSDLLESLEYEGWTGSLSNIADDLDRYVESELQVAEQRGEERGIRLLMRASKEAVQQELTSARLEGRREVIEAVIHYITPHKSDDDGNYDIDVTEFKDFLQSLLPNPTNV